MIYGNSVTQRLCERCKKVLGNRNLHYQDGLWWHKKCHDEAMVEFAEATEKARVALEEARAADEARATEQARRFGFVPSAVQDVVTHHTSQFWSRNDEKTSL